MLKNIIPIIDNIKHDSFIDVFGGTASVLLNKKPCLQTIYNDADERLADFFRVLTDDEKRKQLEKYADTFPASRVIYEEMKNEWIASKDIIKRAFALFYIQSFSFGGKPFDSFGYSVNPKSHNSVSGYLNKGKRLSEYAQRFKQVVIESLDYKKILKKYDYENALFYIDPPYISTNAGYKKELEAVDHKELVDLVLKVKGSVVLSCYDNDVYSHLIENGFEKQNYDQLTCCSRQKDAERRKRVETLYFRQSKKSEK